MERAILSFIGEMVPFQIEGVTDPDGDTVTVSIVLIEQDEPVRLRIWI